MLWFGIRVDPNRMNLGLILPNNNTDLIKNCKIIKCSFSYIKFNSRFNYCVLCVQEYHQQSYSHPFYMPLTWHYMNIHI